MLRDMFKKTYTKIDMKYRAGEKESARTAEEDAAGEFLPGCGKSAINAESRSTRTM